jgi:hypothetical protein
MTSELRIPHYRKIPGFDRRTASDIDDLVVTKRSVDHFFRRDFLPARPTNPSLVGSCVGRLDRILLTIPRYAVDDLAYAYKDLFSKLPAYTRFVIGTHEAARPTVEKWVSDAGLGERAEIFSIGNHLHFSVWAEDGYVVCKDVDSGKVYFVEPFSFPRYGDGLIADFAANATDLENTQAPLYFQGGNVLVGDDFFLIGADYPANSLQYLKSHLRLSDGQDPAEFIRGLYTDYLDHERKLIYVASSISVPEETRRSFSISGQPWTEILYGGNKKGTVQPLFHIDMFLSLVGRSSGGRFKVLVGDPALAAKILGESPSPYAMCEVFDNIAKGMSNAGFDVERNPLPLIYEDDLSRKERFWYFATTNNCLVQNSASDGRIVWLPTYGNGSWPQLSLTDEANKKIWISLGFEVRQLGDFHPFAANLGALHCIKKYLSRSGSA